MSALEVFGFDGADLRAVVVDGEPWFVAADVARILDLGNIHSSIALLDDDEKGVHSVETLGGVQSLVTVSESGLYSLVLRSRKPEARTFKRWLTREVIPAIRRTGAYAVAEVSRRDLALAVLAAEDEADRQRARAEIAESFKHAIESNAGLSPREFHKHYFADTPERQFFDLLYQRGLLIDQRRKGTRRSNGTYRDGSQHGHPTAEGKRYFYLDAGVDEKTGYRFEQARVRPGDPELALVATLTRRGLTPTRTTTEITHV